MVKLHKMNPKKINISSLILFNTRTEPISLQGYIKGRLNSAIENSAVNLATTKNDIVSNVKYRPHMQVCCDENLDLTRFIVGYVKSTILFN